MKVIISRDNMLPHPCKRQSFPQFSFPSLHFNRKPSVEPSCSLTGSVPGFLQPRHRLPEPSSEASCISAKRKGPIQQRGGVFGGSLFRRSQLNRLSLELTLSQLGYHHWHPLKLASAVSCLIQKRIWSTLSSENVNFSGMLDQVVATVVIRSLCAQCSKPFWITVLI